MITMIPNIGNKRALKYAHCQAEILDNAPVLKKSIALRNPYTDVLNLLQIELLRQWQDPAAQEREALRHALFLSINGIAAAMQSTG